MASKSDQFKEKFSKFLQEKNENDVDSDDEYDIEENHSFNAGSLGGVSLGMSAIPHDDDLDVPVRGSLGGLRGKTGGTLGGIGGRIGGRIGGTLGGIGGRTGGTLGGIGGGRTMGGRGSNVASSSRGASSGLGGIGRVKPSEPAITNVPTNTSGEDMSKALGEIAKGTTALQKEVAAFISESQQKNVEAFKEIMHFVHGLADRTVVSFKELSLGEKNKHSDEKPVDEALQALLSNIDKTLKENTSVVYVVSPDKEDNVDIHELSKLLGGKDVQIVDDVRGLCDKVMSQDTPVENPQETTHEIPVQVANITPAASPSKGFPPLRSPMK